MPVSGRSRPGQSADNFHHDVAIIGAGAAGLAATALLRAAGLDCILLEAGSRIGGRAHTIHPDCLGGARFDTGATWLHQTDRNPLVDLARARGIDLVPAHQGEHRLFIGNRPARAHESAAYDAARGEWEAEVRRRLDGPDLALEAAAGPEGPWTANIETWEGTIIAAADPDTLSLRDWSRNQLDDNDLSPPDGVGTLLTDILGPMAGAVRLDTPITAIDWSGADGCRLHGPRGSHSASAVIVTVSTGVLGRGAITFAPELPAATRSALEGLPMGLLSKLALPATGDERLGLGNGTLLESKLEGRAAPAMMLSAWPSGLPYITGFYGGRHARSLELHPARALSAAHASLCRMLGADAGNAVDPGAGLATGWASDPLFSGAYAYCTPGNAGARARLAEPVGDGRVLFAGEACRTDGLAGTVGGAIADGERAAKWLLQRHLHREITPSRGDGFPYAPRAV